jgi:hypothetical protein
MVGRPSDNGSEMLGAFALVACGDVGIGDVWWTRATATMAGGFTLVDLGATPCSVGGRAERLALLDASGNVLPIHVETFDSGASPGTALLQPRVAT